MDARRAVGGAGVLMDRLDALIKPNILAVALRQITTAPGVVARAGNVKGAAEGGDRMQSLIGGYEPEDSPGSECVSRANQAAAFFRISRSSLSRRFSRRRRWSSSRSSEVKPSSR